MVQSILFHCFLLGSAQKQWLKDRENQKKKDAKQAEKAAKVPAKPEVAAAAVSGIPYHFVLYKFYLRLDQLRRKKRTRRKWIQR